MFGVVHVKSLLKLMEISLAFGLGYSSFLHSVAAVCEVLRTMWRSGRAMTCSRADIDIFGDLAVLYLV